MNPTISNLSLGNGQQFLTDGGIETTLIYHYGLDLPHFAAFTLLKEEEGRQHLRRYFESYLKLAAKYKKGFILESPTWRASYDWAYKLGFSAIELEAFNIRAIEELKILRRLYQGQIDPILISGCIGPRGDGYSPANKMNIAEAADYHKGQVQAFKKAKVDMVTAITMNYLGESIGVVRAAQDFDLPVVISFTVETDGKLPDGTTLQDAIEETDGYTNAYPVYYMVNCAHPTHFEQQLDSRGEWTRRIRGIRANASTKSHEELDNSTHLDAGDKADLALQYKALNELLPKLSVIGGCCGTDHSHIEEIIKQVE